MEHILCKIAPCPKPSATDLPTSYLLLCMPKHYLQHLFQWTLKDISGVWSNSHFSALHLNDREEEGNGEEGCGSEESNGKSQQQNES